MVVTLMYNHIITFCCYYFSKMLFVSEVFIALAVIVVSRYFILNYLQRSSMKTVYTLPGPKAFPLIGSSYYFLRRSYNDFLEIIIELTEKYSSPFKFWMGNKLFIGVYEVDQIKTILNNSKEKSMLYEFVKPILGKGLLTAPVSTWIKNRNIILRMFSNIALQKSFDVFVEQSLILTDQLEKIGLNRNKIILHDHLAKYALSAACGTMTKSKTESKQINKYLEVIASVRKTFTSRLRNVFLHFDIIFNFTALGRQQQKNINFLHSFTDKLIQQHIHPLNTQNTNKYGTHKTLLDILIEISHKNKYPQDVIHDNLITMIFAATDTTAITVDFAIFMLANYPEIQENVYKELWEIYGTKTPKCAPIKYEDLEHMNYLTRVIKEIMRIFPPAPLIGRYLTEDVKMGEFILPKGTEIIVGILTLHRNDKYWPNPLVFDPDRFLPENIGKSPKHYMPFSDGSRNCIGKNYAMMSTKIILATLLRTFVFKVEERTPIETIKLNMDITLSSVKPIEVIIKKRN